MRKNGDLLLLQFRHTRSVWRHRAGNEESQSPLTTSPWSSDKGGYSGLYYPDSLCGACQIPGKVMDLGTEYRRHLHVTGAGRTRKGTVAKPAVMINCVST